MEGIIYINIFPYNQHLMEGDIVNIVFISCYWIFHIWCYRYYILNVSNILLFFKFAPFQCWLQLVVFHLKGDFLSNFVLILIILNLLLWVIYDIVKLWNANFWATLGCSFTCYQRKCNLLKSSLWICHLKMIKCTENWTGSPLFTYAATWWSSTLESGE